MPRLSTRVYYEGEWFDSVTEAKWAFFFQRLGIAYRHTSYTVIIDGHRYTPDFYLTQLRCFIEIKGPSPTPEEEEKCLRLAQQTRRAVYLFADRMRIPSIDGMPTSARAYHPEKKEVQPEAYYWSECPICRRVAITEGGSVWECPCGSWSRAVEDRLISYSRITDVDEEEPIDEYGPTEHKYWWIEHVRETLRYTLYRTINTPRLDAAYLAASQYRFNKEPFLKKVRGESGLPIDLLWAIEEVTDAESGGDGPSC